MLFAARGLAGICGANISTAQAYVADTTSAENRTKGMGMIGAAFGIGFVLGPAIGGTAYHLYGEHVPFWIACGLAIVNFLSAFAFLPESAPAGTRARARRSRLASLADAFRTPRLPALLIVFFLVTFAFANLEATFALWLAEPPFRFTPKGVSYIFVYIGIVLVIVQGGLAGRLARRGGEKPLMVAGPGLIAAGMLLLPTARAVSALFLINGIIASGVGINTPATTSLISKASPVDRQGEMLGVAQSMGSLARLFGPSVGGFLFGHFTRNTPYLFGGVLMAGACVLALVSVRGLEREARVEVNVGGRE
jgi:predicted MFS family arabinose efflux permease